MTCKTIRELLWDLCEGSLADDKARSVAEHLDVCPDCARARSEVEAALVAMRSLPEIEPGADFQTGVWQRIDAWEAKKQGFWRGVLAGFVYRNRKVLATSAVAFVVALVGGVYVLKTLVGPDTRMAVEPRTSYEGIAAGVRSPATSSQQGVGQDFVLREIPYRAPVVTVSGGANPDTIYTRFPTRELVPPGMSRGDTYVFEPVMTPVSVGEPVY